MVVVVKLFLVGCLDFLQWLNTFEDTFYHYSIGLFFSALVVEYSILLYFCSMLNKCSGNIKKKSPDLIL